jgi:DNA-binding HxlR family transcriptional regulator
MAGLRSYDDPCGIARALDHVGERWALLVIRELLLGPKRFSDLRGGLPNASPNVLSQRLRELEESGAIQRRQLPPPAGSMVYELTAWGRELQPVIEALARWGSRATPLPRGDLSADALMIALQTTFDPAAAKGLTGRFDVCLGDDCFNLQVVRQRLSMQRGRTEDADAIISGSAAALRQVAFGGRSLVRARQAGDLSIEGDTKLAASFLALFRRPVPVDASAT